jgi:hypothetical protein
MNGRTVRLFYQRYFTATARYSARLFHSMTPAHKAELLEFLMQTRLRE